jgi:hypothetical protein
MTDRQEGKRHWRWRKTGGHGAGSSGTLGKPLKYLEKISGRIQAVELHWDHLAENVCPGESLMNKKKYVSPKLVNLGLLRLVTKFSF